MYLQLSRSELETTVLPSELERKSLYWKRVDLLMQRHNDVMKKICEINNQSIIAQSSHHGLGNIPWQIDASSTPPPPNDEGTTSSDITSTTNNIFNC